MKKEIREQAKIIAAKFGKTYDQRQDIEGRCLEAAWLAEKLVDQDKNPKAYIDTIMKNAAIDYLREEKKAAASSLSDDIEVENPETALVDNITLNETIPAFIQTLKSPDREILILVMEGHTLEEIGTKLNLRPNSIAVRIHRNKKIWKDILKV